MRARFVDWALFIGIAFEVLSGLGSFLVGRPEGQGVLVVHGMVGLAILFLLFWKLRRVRVHIIRPHLWRPSTLAGLLALALLSATVLTGIIWTVWQRPVGYPSGMILHTVAGLALLALYLVHMALRFKPPARRDLRDRRSLLGMVGVLVAGGVLWSAQQAVSRLLDTPGARRRFTGSRETGDSGSFPVTMWMLDNPRPIDAGNWRLTVSGAVDQPQELALDDLAAMMRAPLEATLDCTGGWYTVQDWHGVRTGDLLARAGLQPSAQYVRFRSVTGYRWSLPLEEAHSTLLATQVGGRALSHGHGAPLRLVAPNRRGFQWVKWVVAVEVLEQPDPGQWAAIFASGLG